MARQKNPARACDGCTACCKTHEIREVLKKPVGEWCVHCHQGKGCRIYETRPRPCKNYECAWAQGHGTEEERPDKCGVVVDVQRTPKQHLAFVCIWEVEEGEIEKEYAQQQRKWYLNHGMCVLFVRLQGSRTVTFPLSVPFTQALKDDFLALGVTRLQRLQRVG